jgi:glycine betaine/choline ABC-type transport system substrate-binding protein
MPSPSRVAAVAVALAVGLGACGSDESGSGKSGGAGSAAASKLIKPDPAAKGKRITIGSKNFTESVIVAQIYGQAMQKAGYSVTFDPSLGLELATTQAMQEGQIDGYPEYTGTALTSLLGVDPRDVPKDEDEAYQETKRRYAERYHFVAYPQTPFTNANALGMTAERAKQLGNPRTISDLARTQNGKLTLAAAAECFKRSDCALGFERVYGLRFKRKITINLAQRHDVILRKKADLTIPFTTDGQIAANKEVVLEDDKDLFPPYNVTFVLTSAKAKELGPGAEKLITTVQKGLTTPVMRELNSRADLDRQDPARVATDYLKAEGFVK